MSKETKNKTFVDYFKVYIVIENNIYKGISLDYDSIELLIDGDIDDFEFER
jgi:hypothetical protein